MSSKTISCWHVVCTAINIMILQSRALDIYLLKASDKLESSVNVALADACKKYVRF